MNSAVEKPRRRTQAERSAETQKRILRAAIDCLHRYGYSATSTTIVAEMAEVSRGAMLHQFPTKVDLMRAVLEDAFEQQTAYYDRVLNRVDDPAERLFHLPYAAWHMYRRPVGVAQMEIFLAARSDEDLKIVVREVNKRIDPESREGLAHHAANAGIKDPAKVEALWALSVSVIRGLQTQWINNLAEAPAEEALALLEQTMRTMAAASSRKK